MRQFNGIITPIPTPFREDGEFSEKGMALLLEYLAARGIHGVYAVGSYGSFPMMSVEERMKVAEVVVSRCKQLEMQVIVQIGAPSRKDALTLARHASSIGADAVASVVPFYYSGLGYPDSTVLEHYDALVEAVSTPVHFYNNPKTTSFKLNPSLLSKLIDIGVSGVKDSGGDLISFGEMMNVVRRQNPDFDLMPGSAGILLAGFALGATACVAGTSVVFPELVMDLYRAIVANEYDRATDLQLRVLEARSIQASMRLRPEACYDLLKMRGVDIGTCRKPWTRLSPKDYAQAKDRLAEAGLLYEPAGMA